MLLSAPAKNRPRRFLLYAVVACGVIYWGLSLLKAPRGPSSPTLRAPAVPYTSLPDDGHLNTAETWTEHTIKELRRCEKLGNCGPNQGKAILISSNWVNDGLFKDNREMTGQWARSFVDILRHQGYTVILARENCQDVITKWRQAPDNIQVLAVREAQNCLKDSSILKSDTNPFGLERWKVFDLDLHPTKPKFKDLDGRWSIQVQPHQEAQVTVIPYQVEEICRSVFEGGRAPLASFWVQAQKAEYFQATRHDYSWSPNTFVALGKELSLKGYSFTGHYTRRRPQRNDDEKSEAELAGVTNIENLSYEEIVAHISASSAQIGIGTPDFEPEPFIGLCLGTPFINPIKEWDTENPMDSKKWRTNYPLLQSLGEPWVYNVFAGSYDGLLEALSKTLSNPPKGSLVLPQFSEAKTREAVLHLMTTDWQQEAKSAVKRMGSTNAWIF